MQKRTLPPGHPPLPSPKIGVLLLNLGTPEATDYLSMRRYLSEFLSDRRVIEVNPLFWQILLQGIILTFRPRRSARAYRKIWDREHNESPLKVISRGQARGLSQRLEDLGGSIIVDWAMRYGRPSTASRIAALTEQGCERILLTALYPQYAAATTATAYDKAFDALKKLRRQPAVRTAPAYHDHPAYIEALAASLTAHLQTLEWEPEVIITSYHGLPKSYFIKGDPYHCHCCKTTRLLGEALPDSLASKLKVTFQSRFGPEEWLQPYTDITLGQLARDGIRRAAVITPGFSADCVETLEEINIEARESFLESGGEHFTFIPCLNDTPAGISAIEALVRRELSGWIDA